MSFFIFLSCQFNHSWISALSLLHPQALSNTPLVPLLLSSDLLNSMPLTIIVPYQVLLTYFVTGFSIPPLSSPYRPSTSFWLGLNWPHSKDKDLNHPDCLMYATEHHIYIYRAHITRIVFSSSLSVPLILFSSHIWIHRHKINKNILLISFILYLPPLPLDFLFLYFPLYLSFWLTLFCSSKYYTHKGMKFGNAYVW